MNRVMCTAEDNGIPIYYMDTDSMHLHKKHIPNLYYHYNQRYPDLPPLIGKDMCQFHGDFDLDDWTQRSRGGWDGDDIVSTHFICVGKKAYIDCLKVKDKDNKSVKGFHCRMKGVPTNNVIEHCNEQDIDLLELYKRLYAGDRIAINCLNAGRVQLRSEKI